MNDFKTIEDILTQLPVLQEKMHSIQETLIANLIMLSEIPAPTFDEEARVKLLMQRLLECDLDNISSDEAGNGVGVIPGRDDTQNILLCAHADTPFSAKADHTLSVRADHIIGAGVADNSLGMAVLATIPTILNQLGIKLNSNLVLLASTKGLGRGDLDGLRFFMENNKIPFTAGVCIEGAQIGRLSYTSAGMFRGEIICIVPEELDWRQASNTGAIVALNDVINRILEIRLPNRPKTTIVLGAVRGGKSFNIKSTEASLRFEVRSDDADIVADVQAQIEEIVADLSSLYSADITFDIVSSRSPGGISVSHPLVRSSRQIMEALEIPANITPSMSELSILIEQGLPAVTVGLTEGTNLHHLNETVSITPIFTGLIQLIALLLAIDGGFCNESE